jgi:hypothetical protein
VIERLEKENRTLLDNVEKMEELNSLLEAGFEEELKE